MQNKKENAIFYIVDLLVLGRNILILIVIFLKKIYFLIFSVLEFQNFRFYISNKLYNKTFVGAMYATIAFRVRGVGFIGFRV